MKNDELKVVLLIEVTQECISKANTAFIRSVDFPRDTWNYYEMEAEYYLEKAFIGVLVILERLELLKAYREVKKMYDTAQKDGLLKNEMGPEDPFLMWGKQLNFYLESIASMSGLPSKNMYAVYDLISIIRRTAYYLSNEDVFDDPPQNERDVHNRIEEVLKCYYSDLKQEPVLTKPIKNFRPDTGIQSLRTLIEYKYITSKTEARRVSDEILTDTGGYKDQNWEHFIFVIYETKPIIGEDDWNRHLKECHGGRNVTVLVLSGEPKVKKLKKS